MEKPWITLRVSHRFPPIHNPVIWISAIITTGYIFTHRFCVGGLFFIVNNSPEPDVSIDILSLVRDLNFNVQIINNPGNTGYGAGNNLAIAQVQSKYHLVLNPDAFLDVNALKHALAYLDVYPDVGLLCPRILNEDGSQQFVHRRDATLFDMFLRSFAPRFLQKMFARRIDEFQLKHLDWECEQDIESPSGCCMLFRTEVLKKIHGFDEAFFMYYDDSDIGRRVRVIAKVRYLPSFCVTHLWERASHRSWKMRWVIIKSGWLYFRKWGGWF